MSKPARLICLHAPSDNAAYEHLAKLLNARPEFRCERFELKSVKKLAAPEEAWYLLLLSPSLAGLKQELNWVMEHHPDRTLPVVVKACNPGDIHPRLDFQTSHEFRTGSDEEVKRLIHQWRQDGVCRAKRASSVVMFLSMKGGVAKTTNLVAVAECLAEQGNRVLVIDTDHQCGSSAVLLGEERLDALERQNRTLADLFWAAVDNDFEMDRIQRFASPAGSIADIGRTLSVIPGSLRLEDFWSYFRKTPNRTATTPAEANTFLRATRSMQFRRWFKGHYDYVLVDCPPALAWQVRFFLLAADAYVVPTVPDRLSVRGARYLTRRVQNLRVGIRPVGLVWSMYRQQCAVHRQYVDGIKDVTDRLEWEDPEAAPLPRPFTTVIPHGNDVIENGLVPDSRPTSFANKYGTDISKRYRDLTKEILTRLGEASQNKPAPAAAVHAQ